MISTSGFLTALESPNSFVPDPAGVAYSAPPYSLAGLTRTLLLRGREGTAPLTQIPASAPDTAREVCGRVYVKAPCPSVYLSVCLSQSYLSIAACRCSGFAAVRPAGRRYRSIAPAAAARRSAANASSVTLSADVGSWTVDLRTIYSVPGSSGRRLFLACRTESRSSSCRFLRSTWTQLAPA